MATADNTNVLGSFIRAFQQGRQGVTDRQQAEQALALNEQLKQLQIATAQAQLLEAQKTPQQRDIEAFQKALGQRLVNQGGVRFQPGGPIEEVTPEAQQLIDMRQIAADQGAIPFTKEGISGIEMQTAVPGYPGFVQSPALQRSELAQDIARLTAETTAKTRPLAQRYQVVQTADGPTLQLVTGPEALTTESAPITVGGERVKAPVRSTSSTGAMTEGQQNSLLQRAAKNSVDPEQFRDPTTGVIDFQSLSIATGKSEGEAVNAANAIRNARLAASVNKSGKPTVSQENFQIYGNRMEQADKVLEGLSDKGFDPTSVGLEGLVGQWSPNLLKTSDRQSYEQAQRNFINAVLRKESGAVISDSEFDNARIQYFPQPGDSADLLSQKAATRRLVIDEFKKLGGTGDSAPTPASSAPAPGKITRDQAASILQEAGGDKALARQIATQRGLSF